MCALGDVIQLVAGHGGYIESLDEVIALLAVAVNTVVDGALIVLLEYLYMEDILADEYLVCYLGDFKLAILIEDDDVIEVGAVAYEFILLQPCTNETFLTVDIEFLVSFYHLGNLNGIKVSDFCFARMVFPYFPLRYSNQLMVTSVM